MKRKFKGFVRSSSIFYLLAASILQLLPASASAAPTQQNSNTVAFVNVNIIPMDAQQVLENQTVIVRGERISEIGLVDEVNIPAAARIIEGGGAYLMPGLADMHTHLDENIDALAVYLAHGVTTIRNFNSEPHILEWRDQVAAGELLGPIIRPGLSIGGTPPQVAAALHKFNRIVSPFFAFNGAAVGVAFDERDGRQVVLQAKEDGYEFIKANFFLTRNVFDSIVATAAEVGLPIRMHVSADIGVEHAIRSGAEIQHNYSLMEYVAKNYTRGIGPNPLDKFDLSEADQKLPELAAFMRENGVPFSPTMVIYYTVDRQFADLEGVLQEPEYRHVPTSYIEEWGDRERNPIFLISDDPPDQATRDKVRAYHKRQVKALSDVGVPLLAGTDASCCGIVWGFSLHQELELLVDAGLTPYQALEAATRVPAEVVGNSGEWGTVAVGKRADLLLLKANPLANIRNTREIEGVMVRGQWLPQAELQGMLDELAAKYEAQ
ncbi:amidohydrolase family protein [Chloroflexi bacterium TSY]|nr:amidohydrolase family protein [Chloroflexi bacterium TSY]